MYRNEEKFLRIEAFTKHSNPPQPYNENRIHSFKATSVHESMTMLREDSES